MLSLRIHGGVNSKSASIAKKNPNKPQPTLAGYAIYLTMHATFIALINHQKKAFYDYDKIMINSYCMRFCVG